MEILVLNNQNDLSLSVDSVRTAVAACLAKEASATDEVSLSFVDKEAIAALHQEFFDDPTPTDCISFPLDQGEESYHVLGEVVVCPRVALDYVQAEGGDPYKEVTLYLVHGLLHLLGYDDQEPEAQEVMRRKEASLLSFLAEGDLLLKKDPSTV